MASYKDEGRLLWPSRPHFDFDFFHSGRDVSAACQCLVEWGVHLKLALPVGTVTPPGDPRRAHLASGAPAGFVNLNM